MLVLTLGIIVNINNIKHVLLVIAVAIGLISIGFMVGHMYSEIEFHMDNKVVIHGHCK